MRDIQRNILLNPGPATTTDTVKFAQVVPDICPREQEFGSLMSYISQELARFVANPEDYTTVLFGGSGTAAVEAIIGSVVGGDPIAIVNNGAYGKRMCEIAEAYGLDFYEFASAPDQPIDLTALEMFIQSCPRKVSHLAVVHLETTTGLLNEISSIGQICSKYRMDLIVDAMSSYAAVPISMEQLNISYLAASSNKSIQGMAGVSFCIAKKSKLESGGAHKPRNYYLNLYAQHNYFALHGQMRFTPPVQTLYALKQAIEELKQEGIEQRYLRYSKSWDTLIQRISELGLSYLVPKNHHSKIVTAIVEPDCEAYDFNEMHDYFYDRGFTIYPGKLGALKTFRIANIGEITYEDIEAFTELLGHYLKSIHFVKKGG